MKYGSWISTKHKMWHHQRFPSSYHPFWWIRIFRSFFYFVRFFFCTIRGIIASPCWIFSSFNAHTKFVLWIITISLWEKSFTQQSREKIKSAEEREKTMANANANKRYNERPQWARSHEIERIACEHTMVCVCLYRSSHLVLHSHNAQYRWQLLIKWEKF